MQKRILCGVIAGVLAGMLSACGGGNADAAQDTQLSSALISSAKPPGANFNLAPFSLQLPTGSQGKVDSINASRLTAGYTNAPYFYTDASDGAMVMADPAQGWTTSGSLHPRVELHEDATWTNSGVNKLNATVSVPQVPDHTTIGQIFQGNGPSKPLCELQVAANGGVNLFIENTNQGGGGKTYAISNVPLGTRFNYELSLSGTTISVTVNNTSKTFTMDSSFNGESFYFKAGDYDQSAVSGTPLTTTATVVKFYALALTHKSA